MDNKVQENNGDVYCPTYRNEKCAYISANKTSNSYDSRKRKAYCHVLNIPCKDQKPTTMLFGGDGTHCFATKTSRDCEKENFPPFWRNFSANHNQGHTNQSHIKQKSFHLWQKRVDTPLVDSVNQKIIYLLILYTSSLQYSKIFPVSNDGTEWSLDYGPDSVTMTVRDLVRQMTKRFPRNSSPSLGLVVVSEARLFKQPSRASSSYP